MVGNTGTLAAMWAELHKHLDIVPPTNLDGSVYRGVKPHGAPPDMEIVVAKRQLCEACVKQQEDVHTPSKQRSGNEVLPALGQPTLAGNMSTIPSPSRG